MDCGKTLDRDLKVLLIPPPRCTEDKPTPTGASDGSTACASVIAMFFLALNCGVAIYHSRHDPSSVLFVAACFVDLTLLFYLLRVFEKLPAEESPKRRRVKAAVWALTTTLTVMFSQRVAALMPAPVAAAVWAMAAATIVAGFYMFFVCWDDAADEEGKTAGKLAEGP
jgi:hypothetical protein